jgi:signal transduction histidine kinase
MLSPMASAEGMLVTAAIRDISVRKKAEEHLVKTVGELKRSNDELGQFAYVASHDLKAPLRVIDNASKWLEEDLREHLTGETRDNMNLMRGRIRRMEKLLDDLLEYSRIGVKADDRLSEIISGDVLIENVLALLSPPKDFTVFADIRVSRMPLQQILMNLISNAIKHHDREDGRIEVTAADAGVAYAFEVKDDGPGIPAQFHDLIFKMFQTLKPRDQVEGSGMGLAMVRKNIDVFGGTLNLESSEGRGSIFRFTWPKNQRSKETNR